MIRPPADRQKKGVVAMTRFRWLKSVAVLSVVAGTLVVGSLSVEAAGNPLIYHGNEADASFVSHVNGITVMVRVSSSDYTYSTGAEVQGTYVAITLTDDVSGEQLDYLDAFLTSSADFASNLHHASLAQTSFDLQSSTSCCTTQTISVGAVWTATSPPENFTLLSHFCGPPKPCFGLYKIIVTTRDTIVAMNISGIADGIDLGQLVGTNAALISSRTGVYLAG